MSVRSDSRNAAVAALVDAQWHQHELALSLPPAVRRAVAEREQAALLVADPLPSGFREWSGHTARTLSLYDAPDNRARLAWLLKAIDDGERIVDIGPGSGSVGGRIIHAKHPQRYAAIESSSGKVAAFRGMTAENDIDDSRYELHHAPAEQVAAAVIADVQPTLVLLLEVLEHVSDPGSLITLAADVMPEDCDLILSVPIVGRIEHEWGHLSVFDRPRLEQLASSAGLSIHWVQPIVDLWLFLVLSKSPQPRPRLARLTGGKSTGVTATADTAYFFHQVALAPDATTISCAARTSAQRDLTIGTFSVVRLRVKGAGASLPRTVRVEFAARNRTVERWKLSAREIKRAAPGPRTWVFRRGSDHGRRHRVLDAVATPDTCRITVRAGIRRPAALELLRVEKLAWVSDPPRRIALPPARWRPSRQLAGRVVRRLRRELAALGERR